jgi:hypothetical protein
VLTDALLQTLLLSLFLLLGEIERLSTLVLLLNRDLGDLLESLLDLSTNLASNDTGITSAFTLKPSLLTETLFGVLGSGDFMRVLCFGPGFSNLLVDDKFTSRYALDFPLLDDLLLAGLLLRFRLRPRVERASGESDRSEADPCGLVGMFLLI